MHPSPISVPNDTIFCQNVLNSSPNTVTERYLENLFFFGQKFKFEFWAFFRAFTRCSKTNKIMSYLKINKIIVFCMVDLVNPIKITIHKLFFYISDKEKCRKKSSKNRAKKVLKIGIFSVIFENLSSFNCY